jgi:hypothetical protein
MNGYSHILYFIRVLRQPLLVRMRVQAGKQPYFL